MPDGHLPHLHCRKDPRCAVEPDHRAVSTADDEDVQICVTAPLGDVEDRPLENERSSLMTVLIDERIEERPGVEMKVGDRTVRMTAEQFDAFGAELDAIRERVIADLGRRDADYIRGMVKWPSAAWRSVGRGPAVPAAGLADRDRAARFERRSSTTWRSGTTSCTASTTGWATRR